MTLNPQALLIAIGSDHAGYDLKAHLVGYINELDIKCIDKGCFSSERADYSDYGHAVSLGILNKEADLGILICGSGNGIAMTANKHKGIRAAVCWNNEVAALAKQHNNANILVLPARFISLEEAQKCVDRFLNETFEGGRHEQRVQKIDIK
ncbi:MAG: ribose 5-phosphate isomerase B [Sphingobacteriaceae bacterium]|nr:ribose 5-phosphate isomerase B [Sphingobacteriaceae bacterium]